MKTDGLKARFLRNVPGVRKYYETIARLDRDRVELTRQLEAERETVRKMQDARAQPGGTGPGTDPALAEASLAERRALHAEMLETQGKLGAALALAQAHETERNALRADMLQTQGKLSAALALAQAHELERNALRDNLDAQRFNVLKAEITGHADLILRRLADAQVATKAAEAHVSANILGASARQEELIDRLVRGQRGTSVGEGGADLYLDLLESSLTGALIQDEAHSPWTTGAYDPALRAIGRDWPRQALTMIGTSRMRNLRMLTVRAITEQVPGDFIETGVWRGGACIYAKGIFRAMGASNRRVFVADSFRGLPEPNAEANPADAGDMHHTYAELAIPRSEVEAGFRRYGLLEENVVFLEGWFKDTLPSAPIERLAVLRLDGDMYESTMDALQALYHKVSPGGFVIVDDYILKPCAEAIEDFRARHGITAPLHPVDGAAVWWQVPA